MALNKNTQAQFQLDWLTLGVTKSLHNSFIIVMCKFPSRLEPKSVSMLCEQFLHVAIGFGFRIRQYKKVIGLWLSEFYSASPQILHHMWSALQRSTLQDLTVMLFIQEEEPPPRSTSWKEFRRYYSNISFLLQCAKWGNMLVVPVSSPSVSLTP